MSAPFDAGLQPERTLLAWRRTCLALGLGSVVAARFTAQEFGALGALLGAVGVLLATGAYVASSLRYRRAHDDLTTSARLSTDGVPLALLAATVVVVALASALYVLAHGSLR